MRTVNSNKSSEIKDKTRNLTQLDPIEDNDDEDDDDISSVITDSSVASVIEAVKKATESSGGKS